MYFQFTCFVWMTQGRNININQPSSNTNLLQTLGTKNINTAY